jgi:hypothetical protein
VSLHGKLVNILMPPREVGNLPVKMGFIPGHYEYYVQLNLFEAFVVYLE